MIGRRDALRPITQASSPTFFSTAKQHFWTRLSSSFTPANLCVHRLNFRDYLPSSTPSHACSWFYAREQAPSSIHTGVRKYLRYLACDRLLTDGSHHRWQQNRHKSRLGWILDRSANEESRKGKISKRGGRQFLIPFATRWVKGYTNITRSTLHKRSL